MNLRQFNALDQESARKLLFDCCAATRWVDIMLSAYPYRNAEELFDVARSAWNQMKEPDLLEAFAGHPRIGDIGSLKAKYASTMQMAGSEQSATQEANQNVLQELKRCNQEYDQTFGFIFIVFATGKNAKQMLELLKKRLHNNRDQELVIAAAEQLRITLLRLEKLL